MRSLTFKLTLAFLVVSLMGVALVAVFSRRATVAEFDRLVLDQAQSVFVASAAAYYQANGSWAGVAAYLRRAEPLPQAPPPQAGAAGTPGPLPQPDNPFLLADQSGRVLVPAGRYRLGDHLPANELGRGTPVEVEGQIVGTVLTFPRPPVRDPREEQYLARTNQALLFAAVGATGLALLLGLLLARTLTHPLRELTAATRAVAQGDLAYQVPVRSPDELGELAASFNQMSADLARANELRRQMAADVAHDLRTPLSVIRGYAEGLRDGVLSPSPHTFDIIHAETEHLSRLVEDLRTLSLADAGELGLARQPVPPRELLERTAAAHHPRAQQLAIALQVSVAADVPLVNVDPERMAQVLDNLVSNALRHTPAGGQISLSARRQGEGVLLVVQDNGAGIAPDELPRIFDRFYRGDEARQTHTGESGLGLAIAKSIVELHGGAICVESILGEGTTFLLSLPCNPE